MLYSRSSVCEIHIVNVYPIGQLYTTVAKVPKEKEVITPRAAKKPFLTLRNKIKRF